MMTFKDDPINAFRMTSIDDELRAIEIVSKGLTKREYFAIRILQSQVSFSQHESELRQAPKNAVTLADLLIEALNK